MKFFQKLSTCIFLPLLFYPAQLFGKEHSFFLVHGALLTAQSWTKIQSLLSQKNKATVAFQVPGRAGDTVPTSQITLDYTVKKACEEARKLPNSLIWVGHSQGGAIITQALSECPEKIAALVYIAAVVPLPHEGAFQELTSEEDRNFNQCASFDPEKKLFVFNPKGPIHEMFMNDLSQEEARIALQYFVSEPSEIGAGILDYPQGELLKKPKYYVETLEDKIIFPSTQKKYQAKVQMKKVFTMNSSHSPFLSHPEKVAAILEQVSDDLN